MKRPWFLFFGGDWRVNVKLQRCSHAERGIWIGVLCLMHASEEYGVLRWNLKEIAQVIGCKVSELRALRDKGVLKGADSGEQCQPYVYVPRHARKSGEPVTLIAAQPGPIFFSSRMVRDEYVRKMRIGESPEPAPEPAPEAAPEAAPNTPLGDCLGVHPDIHPSRARPSVVSNHVKHTTAASQPKDKVSLSEIFLKAWDEYPKRAGGNSCPSAWAAWQARLRQGHTEDEMLAGVRRYAIYVRATGKEKTEFVKQAATFFGRDKHFLEDYPLPAAAAAGGRGAGEKVAL